MKHQHIPFLIIFTLLISGCATPGPRGPYGPGSAETRSPLTAERLTQEAAALIETDPEKAEILLRDALAADLYHGPAHNNLGVLYLQQNNLYEAAQEFQWAAKLMPGHPDPRLNLAQTLEQAGHIDDALESYSTALEVYPNHLPTLQALARCQLRHSKTNENTQSMLREITLRGETEQWRDWANRQLLRLKGGQDSS